MSKHTPGPWKVITGEGTSFPDTVYIQAVGKHGFRSVLAELNDDGKNDKVHGSDHDRQANAALIAAAPELLEACKAVVARSEFLWGTKNPPEIVIKCSEAITKAEGR